MKDKVFMSRRKMKGFPMLVSVEEALASLAEKTSIKQPAAENVPLEESLGRYCAVDVVSPVNVPSFDRSAVDGYAVRAVDTFGASPTNPVALSLVGSSLAGMKRSQMPRLGPGQAVEIYTGASIPEGADSVVMAEYVRKVGEGLIEVMRQVHPLQNVSKVGEDYRKGEVVVERGVNIRSWHIGALASLNITEIPVFRRLRIGVLSTGGELVEPGGNLEEGKVVNSSKPMLKALITENGCLAVDLGTVEDDLDEVASRISEGLKAVDMLIVTGGTSVGEKDIVPEAVNRAGEPGVVFHGVRIRPAKPTGAGVVDGKPVFMLSGYPVSAMIGFTLFVKPFIDKAYSRKTPIPSKVRGRLNRRIPNQALTRTFVRVRVEKTPQGFVVDPLMLTGSGLLSTLTKANAILVIPEDVEGYDEGEEVEVDLLTID
ncbi:MAG: molybdopterin molybdotransferase MoeA [Candidatus Caldarchaeum sp.]|nr:molybdopterin molybdotransferase MoeA [Candidatus Caldarchaeum sp.]